MDTFDEAELKFLSKLNELSASDEVAIYSFGIFGIFSYEGVVYMLSTWPFPYVLVMSENGDMTYTPSEVSDILSGKFLPVHGVFRLEGDDFMMFFPTLGQFKVLPLSERLGKVLRECLSGISEEAARAVMESDSSINSEVLQTLGGSIDTMWDSFSEVLNGPVAGFVQEFTKYLKVPSKDSDAPGSGSGLQDLYSYEPPDGIFH